MLLLRLSGRKVCERVKQKGLLWKGKHMQARYLFGSPRNLQKTASNGIYVGVLTSAKLDKSAVKRNRMRRRCREALRLVVKENVSHGSLLVTRLLVSSNKERATSNEQRAVQLLLLPRSSSLTAAFGEIQADARTLLTHLQRG